ncbi:MAG: sulfatase-like hydrolase/transferase [Balneolaceae bacterium]
MSMKRKEFLQKIGAGAAGLPFVSSMSRSRRSQNPANAQPNILFITTDYQAGEDGPSLGSPFLRMPNLDRLCNEGVIFERHYCTAPICVPSRYTLVTGQYPHTHGARDNTGAWVPDQSPILMEHLAEAGYYGVGIGKMHFSPWERMAGFHQRIIACRKGNSQADDNRRDDYAQFLARHGLSRWSYLRKQGLSDIYGVFDWPFADEFHIDHYVGEQTVRAIENYDRNEPWFIWSSFNGPHNPWDPPARCTDRYKRMSPGDLHSPRLRPEELDDKPLDHTRLRYNYTRGVPDRIDQALPEERPGLVHRMRAGHYGGLEFIDEQIGRIMRALEEQGQLDNTIIVYSADHGCELGDHHNIHKGLMYERSSRVPMVVWSPPRYRARRVQGYSAHVDLFPTLLSMAGTGVSSELEDKLEGMDLVPVLEGRSEGAEAAYIEIRSCTGIVTDDWKLGIHPSDGEGELYDRREDPDELVNLYNDPHHQQIRRELTERLVQFHPPLAGQIERMSQVVFEEQEVYIYEEGAHVPSNNSPAQAGRRIQIAARLRPGTGGWRDGPVFTAHVAGVHGYALYIKNGRIAFGFRKWGSDMVIQSPEQLPIRATDVEVVVSRDGELRLLVNGTAVSSGKVAGTLPVQPGRERITAPQLFVARSPGWAAPIGEYEQGAEPKGQVREVHLRVM